MGQRGASSSAGMNWHSPSGYFICCLVPDPSKNNSATDAACTLKWHEGVVHIKVAGVLYFPKRRMGGTTKYIPLG